MPIPQIVIDTNVLVAGLRSRRGSAFRLLTLVGMGLFDIHLSVPLVCEYEEALLREPPRLQVTRTVVEDLIDFHCAVAKRHQIFFLWRPYLRDPKDDMLLVPHAEIAPPVPPLTRTLSPQGERVRVRGDATSREFMAHGTLTILNPRLLRRLCSSQ
jgi:predicted nucleic acid-binding protein